MPPRRQRIHKCPVCNMLYPATFRDQIYCSTPCNDKAYRLRKAGLPLPIPPDRDGSVRAASPAAQRVAVADPTLGVGGILVEQDGRTSWVPVTAALESEVNISTESARLVFGTPIPIDDAPTPTSLRAAGVPLGEGAPPPHSDQAHESGDMSELPTASSREKEKGGEVQTKASRSSGQHMVWRPYKGKLLPEQEEMLKGHYLRAYEATGCRKLDSCRQTCVEPSRVDRWQEDDPDFALRVMELHMGLLEELRAVNIAAARNPEKGFLSRITELKRLDPAYRERQVEVAVGGPVQINIVYKAQELPQGGIVEGEVKELPSG